MQNRNEKYYNKMTNKNKQNMYPIKLDITALDLFCNFIVSENETIHRTNFINLNKLISKLDLSLYENDKEKMTKINFIKRGLEARMTYRLNEKDLILLHINGGLLNDNLNIYTQEINNDQVKWVNKIVLNALEKGYMIDNAQSLQTICNRFISGDFASNNKIIKEFENAVASAYSEFRQNNANASSDLYFSLEDDVFIDCIGKVYKKKTSPNNKLITGCVGINELLGGGFEATRVYAFFGLPGEGKSITLLDMCLQIKNYNKGYICKDPRKKPCVVYLTLENGLEESVERLAKMVGVTGDISDYSVNDLINKLRTEGELYLDKSAPIDLIMKYEPGGTVDTDYLYTMAEDLEDKGNELIAVAVDYIKRIRSIESGQELRIQYGNIINEFKNFATQKDLVLLTASQLNRDAISHIDESRQNNRLDLVRTLGRSQIGESSAILENLDGGFLILPETKDDQKWLGIQRIKNRYNASSRKHLYYRYQYGIKLIEDLNAAEPAYISTLKDNKTNFNNVNRYNEVKSIEDIDGVKLLKSEDNNIFSSGLTGTISTIDDDIEEQKPIYRSVVRRIKP